MVTNLELIMKHSRACVCVLGGAASCVDFAVVLLQCEMHFIYFGGAGGGGVRDEKRHNNLSICKKET